MRFLRSLGWASIFFGGSLTAWGAAGTKKSSKEFVSNPAMVKQAEADLKTFEAALMMYKLNAGTFPTGEQGLQSLIEKPKADPVPRRWVQLMVKIPQDPWGRDYRYVTRKRDETIVHVIISSGPDALSPDDDIEAVLEGDKK